MKKNMGSTCTSWFWSAVAKHPDVVKYIKTQLQGLCTSGVPVNALISCLIMLAIIKHHAPDLLVKF